MSSRGGSGANSYRDGGDSVRSGGMSGGESEEDRSARHKAEKKKLAAMDPKARRARRLREEQAKEEAAQLEALKKKKAKEKAASPSSSKAASGANTKRTDSTTEGGDTEDELTGGETERTDDLTGDENPEDLLDDDNVDGVEGGDDGEAPSGEAAGDDAVAEAQEPEPEIVIPKSGPEEDLRCDLPKSPLIAAVMANIYEQVKLLIQEQPIYLRIEYVNQYDENGNSPIFFALSPEHADVLNLLLDYGADPCFQNNRKNTALHLDCVLGFKKSIKTLIDYGADVQMENWEYQQPHQMVKELDKVSTMQAYLNSCYEAHKEAIKEKQKHAVNRYQRSYLRSLFDIADTRGANCIPYNSLENLLTYMTDGILKKPDLNFVFAWFRGVDKDKNGYIDFKEFLYASMQAINDRERAKKKGKRGKSSKKKKKK